MLTYKNYQDYVAQIPYGQLPKNVKAAYDFVKEFTKSYTNWSLYHKDADTKETCDIYFGLVEKYLPKQKENVKSKSTSSNQPDIKKVNRTVQPRRQDQEDENTEYIEKLDEEIKFIKRYVNLNGKKKTEEEILRFINALQKAIIERKVRKSSPYAKQIMFIQDSLIGMYTTMKKTILVDITEKKLAELSKIIAEQTIFPSISFIKRFLNLVGKDGIKEKAELLMKQMKNAVDKGKISESDKYSKKLSLMYKALYEFTSNPKQKELELSQQELSGLNGVLGECNCNSLQGELGYVNPDIINSMDFVNMEFETLGFTGKWLDFLGDPSRNFTMMVSGKPKYGKSVLCIDFAGYLARHHGRVLYIAKEEGVDKTLQKKFREKNVQHPNLSVLHYMPSDRDLQVAEFLFLDSVTTLNLKPEDIMEIKRKFPHLSIILIMQTTKQGVFRGSNMFRHDVDIVVEVPEFGRAVQMGRFNEGSELKIFEESETSMYE